MKEKEDIEEVGRGDIREELLEITECSREEGKSERTCDTTGETGVLPAKLS